MTSKFHISFNLGSKKSIHNRMLFLCYKTYKIMFRIFAHNYKISYICLRINIKRYGNTLHYIKR